MDRSINLKESLKVLEFLHDELEKKGIFWILICSTALLMHGVKVQPHKDIDILVDQKDALDVDEILAKYRIRPPVCTASVKFKSCFAQYEKDGVKIDVMSNFQYKKEDGTWTRPRPMDQAEPYIVNDKMTIMLDSLEHELEQYTAMDRPAKVEKIKERLAELKAIEKIKKQEQLLELIKETVAE